ncbi:ABC transporter substrate-binding protein [Bradyrhizobium sp. U87765 SZCCT0131]|uniref:ABC transporter substrate-binding protein n=1 Tax=unclassified Bradyrhizobium TaxID=2631580 RepID=UPI001BAC54C7|nr:MULTISPECIES: ABC transporter substrate-binding protein [unclassified Bradyrhizobium]MBR1222695.1 ABC transporter substrate-binding protein [Bradyrhizobium sp. U87765 SZCCT0131]MBR1265224.1 ABC transporter substrate-binding protein [Bradyrhizobium sp. U87765 SZCCT0134]MBR1302997.1 ABC transporter substrate-binding protein [Bradyrhizobium sp. U87765 SZCCT0110]MBR1323695.1 ABC transporter substrate-binding protein [Bradyrhizobium sp. U87765 SZCCT0109]MBR1346926.1 ABC transporter substrate-bin
MKKMIATIAAFAWAGLSVTTPASAADKVVLMLNWYVYGEHAPFYYGKEKGIYAAEGIDLDIQEGRGSAATTQAVAAKTANFGYVDVPTMMRATIKGAPVIATGVLLQTSPMSVMGFADKNIRKPEDIKGKTVAITPADSMTQIWPLFLKRTGLKEADFKTVAGDGQTKLNAVINGQADLLLGYVMDQSMKIKDATGKDVYPIKFADYGINMVSSGIIANTDYVKQNGDIVKRFMAATTKAVEAAEKDPKAAAQSILNANPKGGKIETLTQGFELTIPLYRTPETKGERPFRVTDGNMVDSVSLMVEYGGLDSKALENPKAFYTNDYLPSKTP